MVVPYQSFPNSGEDVSASVSADHQRWNGERPPGEEIYLLLVICSPPLKIWKWLSAAGQIRCTMMTMLRNATTFFFPPALFSLKCTIEAVTLNDEWPKQEPKFGQIHSFIFRIEVVKMAYWTRSLLYYIALSYIDTKCIHGETVRRHRRSGEVISGWSWWVLHRHLPQLVFKLHTNNAMYLNTKLMWWQMESTRSEIESWTVLATPMS